MMEIRSGLPIIGFADQKELVDWLTEQPADAAGVWIKFAKNKKGGGKSGLSKAEAIDAALFDIHTRDEIVVDTNVGGRSTFRNAGSTTRRGGEISYVAQWGDDFRSTVALTSLTAKFDNGKRLPGTAERSAFAELVFDLDAFGGHGIRAA